jgi:nicotinamide riboside kinase
MVAQEESQIANANKFLFCDTDLLMMKVWYEVKFKQISNYLLDQLNKNAYDHYLICSPDLPWQEDPLRENPHLRDMLFERYIKEVEERGISYTIIEGKKREETAITVLEEVFQ